MENHSLIQKLKRLNQQPLLNVLRLNLYPSKAIEQILAIDEEVFHLQRKSLSENIFDNREHYPFTNYRYPDSSYEKKGLELLQQGKVGCIVMAGGQGTRLRFVGPKGCFPISIIKKKSLFQLLSEKVLAASIFAKKKLPLAIMTSSHNDMETRQFFEEHKYFNLDREQVFFYKQNDWPLLDLEGNLFFDSKDTLALGPNGNGSSLKLFYQSGIWSQWKEKGITHLTVLPIDNPLALPFEPSLIGLHEISKNEATLKTILRHNPIEKVGVIVEIEKKTTVIEYTELSLEEKTALNDKGELKFGCANLSMFCFTMQFIEDLAIKLPHLPMHRAKKSAKMLIQNDKISLPYEANAWKFEEYIFDVLQFTEKNQALIFPREQIFAPLKNYKGEDSIETVQAALQRLDLQTYCKIAGFSMEKVKLHGAFELSQEFYYPTQELKQKWKNRPLPQKQYIETELT